jgi:type VI protein secretion system component VasF
VAMLDVENAQELAEQAGKKLAATTQEVVAEGRKRVGRKAKKRAQKLEHRLERRVAEAAKRLPVDTPVDRRRRRRTAGRTALIVRLVLAGAVIAAVYVAWRARNQRDGTAESGPAPDAFGAAVGASDDGEHTSVTSPQQ